MVTGEVPPGPLTVTSTGPASNPAGTVAVIVESSPTLQVVTGIAPTSTPWPR